MTCISLNLFWKEPPFRELTYLFNSGIFNERDGDVHDERDVENDAQTATFVNVVKADSVRIGSIIENRSFNETRIFKSTSNFR